MAEANRPIEDQPSGPPTRPASLESEFQFAAIRHQIKACHNVKQLQDMANRLAQALFAERATSRNLLLSAMAKSHLPPPPLLPPPTRVKPDAGAEVEVEPAETLFFAPRETFDEAIIGWAARAGDPVPVACYGVEGLRRVLLQMALKSGDDGQDARDRAAQMFIDMHSAWYGPGTPMVVSEGDAKMLEDNDIG